MKTLQNRVAVVTGAGSGIGRALAQRLLREGCHLALADVRPEGLAETVRLLGTPATKVTTHTVDVSKRAQVEAFARQVEEQHGAAHLLVNNAGVALYGLVEQLSIEDYEWLMGINFWGVVYGVKSFLPLLARQDEAHIVNLSSLFGLIAPPAQSAYCAAKFAVRGFTESLRHELAGSRIAVTVVHPGGVRTAIATSARVPESVDQSTAARHTRKFNKLLRLPPERAADLIVDGVLKGKTRILVGNDAKVADKLQRLLPETYWNVMGKGMGADVPTSTIAPQGAKAKAS